MVPRLFSLATSGGWEVGALVVSVVSDRDGGECGERLAVLSSTTTTRATESKELPYELSIYA